MAMGPIPFEAIDRYAERVGIYGDQFFELQTLISRMDKRFLELQRKD